MSDQEATIEEQTNATNAASGAIEADASDGLVEKPRGSDRPAPSPLDLVIDVPLRLTVEIGSSRMPLREVLQLGKGAVVDLDRAASDPADILVNGRLIARGDLTTSDDRLAIRVVEIVSSGSESR